MKKYISGISAIACAVIFSAFTKPFATLSFKLLHDPVVANLVTDPNEWSTGGIVYGNCIVPANDIACEIKLSTTRSSYFHSVGGDEVLNIFSYANGVIPKQDYLVITESVGLFPDRIISTITPMKWNPIFSMYVVDSLGGNLTWKNGND